ncbi:MAG TPA: AAA family ATPase, partial [Ktedonobacterales bacterium]
MATGWRGWGRRRAESAAGATKDDTTAGGVSALNTREDLLRAAAWPRLAADRRTALLQPYRALAEQTTSRNGDGLFDITGDHQTQDWIADLVKPGFQPEAVSVVRTWLESAPPNTHLYVIGPPGRGRQSVVAALARRAMAGRPLQPDYCYAPDPSSLSHTVLLALPPGVGVRFADLLGIALRQVLSHWEKPHERGERGRADGTEDGDDDSARRQLVERYIEPLASGALAVARPYVQRLVAALIAQANTAMSPQVAEVDAPAGRSLALEALAADGADPASVNAPAGAPVIITSLTRTDLGRSLLRANGGVLVLSAADLVERDQPNAEWATLRASLRAGSIPMRGTGEPPVPLAVRVALIGTYAPYRLLERSEDFARLFRYKAKFEDDIEWTPEVEATYAALTEDIARRYSLPTFDASAVGCLVEEGARRVSDRNRTRVTTDLLTLRDLAAEAGHQALARARSVPPGAAGADAPLPTPVTTAADVEATLAVRRMQQGNSARQARSAILQGREFVPTAGAAVGQVNGLGVVPLSPTEGRYATPFRLTITVSPGRERLVDVEREADTADSTHVAGALTMAGYLAWRYGHERSINVVARARFEE